MTSNGVPNTETTDEPVGETTAATEQVALAEPNAESEPNAETDPSVQGTEQAADDSSTGAVTSGNSAEGPIAQSGPAPSNGSGVLSGTVAFLSAGLGLVSLTGMTLGDMLKDREQVVGQLKQGGSGNQIEAIYSGPWHTVALVNGVVGLVAALLGLATMAVAAGRSEPRGWVKPVALAGAVLGVLGILVAGGMYLDLFAPQPKMPKAPPMMGGGQ